MPLWLLCSRRQLQERVWEGWFPPQLPIFKGLIKNEDYGYDVACILDSVHRLGAQGPDQPNFESACELVRKTHSVLDPAALRASKTKMEELMGEPVS